MCSLVQAFSSHNHWDEDNYIHILRDEFTCYTFLEFRELWLSWKNVRLWVEGLLVGVSLPSESLSCVLEQDTFFCCLVLVRPRKTHSDMTEKMMTWTWRMKTNRQNSHRFVRIFNWIDAYVQSRQSLPLCKNIVWF